MLWKRPFPKHCSDEVLLSHVDGELPWPIERLVRKHLRVCWTCRGRLSELEEQAQALAIAFADTSFLGPDLTTRARDRFSAWEERFEANLHRAPNLALMPAAPVFWRWAVPAGLALVACVIWFGAASSNTPRPADVLAAAQKAESAWGGSAPLLHASIRVQISESGRAGRRRRGDLEVWAEPKSSRSAVRWRDPGGALRYAVWRPATGQKFVFDSTSGGPVTEARDEGASSPAAMLLDTEPSLEHVEKALFRWLASGQWRPIDLAARMALFANDRGATLHVETVNDRPGQPTIRLVAERATAGGRAEAVLEIDSVTHKPVLQWLRLEAGGRAVELSMTVERVESMPWRDAHAEAFQPDASLLISAVSGRLPRTPASLEVAPTLRGLPPVYRSPEMFDAAQVDAEYALHRAGACLGESIEVLRQAADAVCIRGLVMTAERRSELLHELTQLRSFNLLRVDLQTEQDAAAQPQPDRREDRRERLTSSFRLPSQDLLERAFGGARQVAQFTNDAVSSSDAALAHAWALEHIGAGYGEVAGRLHPESAWLLEALVRDHLEGVRTASRRLKERSEPLFALAPGRATDQEGRPVSPSVTWNASLHSVFESVRRVDRLVQALAAGAILDDRPGELLAGELRVELLRLDGNVERADEAIKRGLRYQGSTPHPQ